MPESDSKGQGAAGAAGAGKERRGQAGGAQGGGVPAVVLGAVGGGEEDRVREVGGVDRLVAHSEVRGLRRY